MKAIIWKSEEETKYVLSDFLLKQIKGPMMLSLILSWLKDWGLK